MTFQQVLDKYRKISFSEKDKGLRFERLMQAYLQTDPLYASRFSKVWLWNDFPARKDFGGNDTGIDLVALTHTGDYWPSSASASRKAPSLTNLPSTLSSQLLAAASTASATYP